MEIRLSDVVVATKGRDAGKLFFVVGTEPGFALIANGTDRRLEKPKRKKLKHLKPSRVSGGHTAEKLAGGEKVTNRELKRALSGIQEIPQGAEGGMQSWQKTMS